MTGRCFRLIGLLIVSVLACALVSAGNGERAAFATEVQSEPVQYAAPAIPPRPLPHDCDGVTPPGGPAPACCAYGYIYYEDAPVAEANVHIESSYGAFDTNTGDGGFGSGPYYSVDLSSDPLSASAGDTITMTASYSDMISIRTWTVQSEGQQVDLGLVAGYQASEPISTLTTDALDPATVQASDWSATVREDIRRSEYYVTWQDHTYLPGLAAAYQAPNRAHNLRTYFTLEGPVVIPRVWPESTQPPPWRWGLTLIGYGYEGYVRSVSAPKLTASTNRIEYRREGLTEWYVNNKRGLEQGFTVMTAPNSHFITCTSQLVLEFTISGDLRPNLTDDTQAIEFTTTGGVRVLRYSDPHACDATKRELPIQLSIVDSRLSIRVDTTAAVYPITIDPLTTTPNWTAESDQASAEFGYSVSTAGDVNGDGYDDIIIGAPHYDSGETDEGAAFVYHGSATGLSPSPNWVAEGDQGSAEFGYSVGTAGDVDDDGHDDVIVGAPYHDGGETDEGRAYVYRGSATGLSTTVGWIAESDQASAEFGYSVGTAGDVNGDGYDDVIVGAKDYTNDQAHEGRVFVYYGAATGLSATADWTDESDQVGTAFGCSVGTAGDVDSDGYDDVIVGAFHYGLNREGAAFVYHGSVTGLSTNADWTAESDQDGAHFGWSVGTAGDVNGDGYNDIIIGADYYDNDQTDEGRTHVYYGSASGLSTTADWTAEGNQDGAHFGYSVGTTGDVDDDGYDDVIVGAHYGGLARGGAAFVYHGSAGGLSTAASWMVENNQTNAYFGWSASTAGDVNGDGCADVVVGAYGYNDGQADEGRAYVYHGSKAGLSIIADWTAESNQADAEFGWSVGTAGDVNGDGYDDVIVAAHWYDNGQTDEGRVYVYHGSASGLRTTASWTMESDQPHAYSGGSVSTAGDVNGDGYDDVIVGANYYDNGQTDEGRAFVYHGSATGLSVAADWTAESNQAGALFGDSVGTAGDVNGDGYDDVVVGAGNYDGDQVNEGWAFVYHGSATGLSTAADWTAEGDQVSAQFGRSVGTAGDVNGDGYDDVIVTALFYDNGETDEGRAFVYHGSATGLSTVADWTAESDQAYPAFGVSAGTAGDVNGDGYDDVVVGAPGYDNGQMDEGRAFVYHGSATGLSATADWTAESNQDGGGLGWSVGTAGDVDGDGYADVILGARYYDNGQTDEGRAFIYHGSAPGLSATAHWMAEGNQDGAEFGRAVGTAGDVNGDGYDDVIVGAWAYDNGQTDEGRAFVYHGPIAGLAATVPEAASARAGSDTWIMVRSPFSGDINRDSYTVYEYGLSEDGPWTQGCGNGTPGESGWRQCEFRDLAPDTNYYVRVTFVDPDGVVGTNPQILGPIRTRASSVNVVTVDTATVTILDTHLLVSVPISEDSNRDSQLQDVQVAPSDSGPWTQKCGPYPPNYAYAPKLCRIHGLTRDTNYWVRVTVVDPDGVNGPNPQLIGPIHYTGLTNLALGKVITADPGWGCCPDPGQLVDGRIQNPDWDYGFAWTGGTGNWGGGSPGWKQATIDLGSLQQVSRVDIWLHDHLGVPSTWQILASQDGVTYTEVFTTTEFRCRTETEGLGISWLSPSCSHRSSFDGVTARYVRYRFDDRTLLDDYHGWAVEIEVFEGGVAPSAAFTASPLSGTAPLTVTFTDQSSGDITSWLWAFGDGGTSTDQNPTYAFTSPGTYTVSLTVGGPSGNDTETKADYITVDYPAPNAAFTASPLSGPIPLDVQFNDQSVGSIISWNWTFGDGGISGARHPSHIYEDAGSYTASLTASGPGGSDTETKPEYLTVTTGNKIWTFILYFAEDNNLHPDLERAINRTERMANNPNLDILILWDSWQDGDTRLYHVTYDTASGINSPVIPVGWNPGEVNTGITQTLVSFVNWAQANYPADHYFLSIANHGRGTTGIAWDDTSDEDYLSAFSELGSALDSITSGGSDKIDVLFLDACLMGMIEDAYEVKESVEYLVASENLGWSVFAYDAYASSVAADTTPRQLAQNVADAYVAAMQEIPATISALDLSVIESLGNETDELAQALVTYMDSTNITQTIDIRNDVQTFDSRDYQTLNSTDEYVDLYHFAELVDARISDATVQSRAQDVMNAVANCIVAEHHRSGQDPWSRNYWHLDNAHGIAVYFPPRSAGWDYDNYVTGDNWAFCSATAWDDFLVSYFSLITTEPGTPVDPGMPPMLPIGRVFLPLVIRVY
jgi:PKD repeat protein